jgi:short-subunit dehydrogenase
MSSAPHTSVPVLVTGASSGIGEEFARSYAERGHNVTIVARRVDRLEQLAEQIRARHGVEVTVLGADLETARGRTAVSRVLRDRAPWLLINNAGFGSRGRLTDLDAARERGEVQVNVVALHELTVAALPGMVRERAGGVLNVASTAAFQPLPYMTTYGATKAFVLNFTEALAEELKGTGARAMVLCPGPVRTEFDQVAGVEDYMEIAKPMTMSVERCVSTAMKAFDRGRTICVPGALNAVLAQGPRLTPRIAVRKLSGQIFQPRG